MISVKYASCSVKSVCISTFSNCELKSDTSLVPSEVKRIREGQLSCVTNYRSRAPSAIMKVVYGAFEGYLFNEYRTVFIITGTKCSG